MAFNFKDEIEYFKRYLKSKGLNVTRQRIIFLKQVLNTNNHFDADEIFEAVRKK